MTSVRIPVGALRAALDAYDARDLIDVPEAMVQEMARLPKRHVVTRRKRQREIHE